MSGWAKYLDETCEECPYFYSKDDIDAIVNEPSKACYQRNKCPKKAEVKR